ncbi:MAG: phage head closure protein [Rhizobiaceae bacterium]
MAPFQLTSSRGHRLTLQSRSEAAGEDGVLETTWTNVAAVWGAFVSSDIQRREEAQQMVEVLQHQIVIRYRDDLASGWRFLLDDREIAILSVIDPDQTRRFLSCRCEEEAR